MTPDVIDDTRNITITLQVQEEGLATIVTEPFIRVNGEDTNIAREGDIVDIFIGIQNDGADDILFFATVDDFSGSRLVNRLEIPSGSIWNSSIQIQMPDRDLNLTLEVGHVE